MITDINSEDRLVQATLASHLQDVLAWENVYAHNHETFGPAGSPGRASERVTVHVRDLRDAVQRLNADLPECALRQAVDDDDAGGLLLPAIFVAHCVLFEFLGPSIGFHPDFHGSRTSIAEQRWLTVPEASVHLGIATDADCA